MRTASAKGLTSGQVIWRHGLKNALIPVVTYLGLDLAAMVGGTILTETVFNWPGVGLPYYQAIHLRDWPIVMGGVVIIVFLVMVINLLVDISYAFLDPRIRYGRVGAIGDEMKYPSEETFEGRRWLGDRRWARARRRDSSADTEVAAAGRAHAARRRVAPAAQEQAGYGRPHLGHHRDHHRG